MARIWCPLGNALASLPMIAPLIVLEVALLMSATDQLVIAIAALVVSVSQVLPIAVTAWSHWAQSQKLTSNSTKLDRIDASTNGALAAVTSELAALKLELAALKADAARQHPPGAF